MFRICPEGSARPASGGSQGWAYSLVESLAVCRLLALLLWHSSMREWCAAAQSSCPLHALAQAAHENDAVACEGANVRVSTVHAEVR